jgi:ArsC family
VVASQPSCAKISRHRSVRYSFVRGAIWTATYGGLAAKKNFAVIGLGYRPLLRTALRETTSPTAELGLLDEGVSNEVILDAMIKHFILVSRPIVCTPKGVWLCRPSEAVFDLLDPFPPGPFHKEDGELLIDNDGCCVGGFGRP